MNLRLTLKPEKCRSVTLGGTRFSLRLRLSWDISGLYCQPEPCTGKMPAPRGLFMGIARHGDTMRTRR